MTTLLNVIGVLASLAVLGHVFGAINRMSWDTCHLVRAAYGALAVGAAATLISPLYANPEPWGQALLAVGAALFLAIRRRREDRKGPESQDTPQ